MANSKKPIDPKPNKIALVTIMIFCAVVFFGGYFLIQNKVPKRFHLDDDLYGNSEAIDITRADYEKLVSDKKSFIVMVDKPDCYTTANMRKWMSDFPSSTQFKYYRIMWSEAKESSLHNFIKFVPSIAIVHKGEILDYLDADSDEDVDKYDNPNSLRNWINSYILF